MVGKCVITNGCTGRLYKTERNPNNVRESSPSYVEGLDNYVPRRAFYEFAQTLSSNKWKVVHNMGVLPSTFVYIEQEDGTITQVDNSSYTVSVIDKNSIFVTFANRVRGIIQCVAKSTVPLVPSTIPLDVNLVQVSTNGVITFAVPKYLTQVDGTIPSPTPPSITPTITPSPTPTSTPIGLPLNLCATNAAIQIEIEITRPNEDPFVCFEDISNLTDNRSPWSGWGEVLVRKRKNYCVRTASLLKLKVFGNADLEAGDIPNGTRIRFLRIDYGTGRKEVIPSRGLLMLLASSPYAYADKIKNKLIDVGELLGDTPDYFVYKNGELFLDENKIERSYPDISRVIYQAAPPQPSPTPTPTVTATVTATVTPTATPESSMSTLTPTPTPTGTFVSPSPTPAVTATVTPTITPAIIPFSGYIIGPVEVDGQYGMLRTTDENDWAVPLSPLPVTDVVAVNYKLNFVNNALFLMPINTGVGNAWVSFDGGSSWTETNDPLYETTITALQPIVWTGAYWMYSNKRSFDGITWAVNTTLPQPGYVYTAQRASDNSVTLVAYNTGGNDNYISYDNGSSWVSIGEPYGFALYDGYAITDDATRIWTNNNADGSAYTNLTYGANTGSGSGPGSSHKLYSSGTWVGVRDTNIVRVTGSGTAWSPVQAVAAPSAGQTFIKFNLAEWLYLDPSSSTLLKVLKSSDDALTWTSVEDITCDGYSPAVSLIKIEEFTPAPSAAVTPTPTLTATITPTVTPTNAVIDPDFADVVSLMHFEGADASTTFTDTITRTWSVGNDAQIDTAQFKYGSASGRFDGVGDYITTPNTLNLNFGTNDFTIEWFMRFNDKSGFQTIMSKGYNSPSGGWLVQTGNGDGKLSFYTYPLGTLVAIETTGTVNDNQWYHIALVRSGTTFTIYRDGVSVASGTCADDFNDNINQLVIGGGNSAGNLNVLSYNGWMDEFRITNGVARYTATFTPPTQAFPDS